MSVCCVAVAALSAAMVSLLAWFRGRPAAAGPGGFNGLVGQLVRRRSVAGRFGAAGGAGPEPSAGHPDGEWGSVRGLLRGLDDSMAGAGDGVPVVELDDGVAAVQRLLRGQRADLSPQVHELVGRP